MSPIRELLQLELAKVLQLSRDVPEYHTVTIADLRRLESLATKVQEQEDADAFLDVEPRDRARYASIMRRIVRKAAVRPEGVDLREQLREMLRLEIGKRLATSRVADAPTLTSADLVILDELATRLHETPKEDVDLALLDVDDLRWLRFVRGQPERDEGVTQAMREKRGAMRLAIASGAPPSEWRHYDVAPG